MLLCVQQEVVSGVTKVSPCCDTQNTPPPSGHVSKLQPLLHLRALMAGLFKMFLPECLTFQK